MAFVCLSLTSVASEVSLASDVESGWGIAGVIETDSAGTANYPQIDIDASGNAIAVWSQHDGTRYNVMSNRYVVGAGWGAVLALENIPFDGINADIDVDASGNAIAVWSHFTGAYYSIMSNRFIVGTGWEGRSQIGIGSLGNAMVPQVALSASGNATVVWYEYDGAFESIYSNSYVAGLGWEGETLIETGNAGDAYSPNVGIDSSGDAIAVWHQSDGTRNNIWSNRYVAGSGWGTALLIESDDSGHASYPQISVDSSGNAIAVWHQNDGSAVSIYSNRYVAGTGWSGATLVEDDDFSSAYYPQVDTDASGNAIAIWGQGGDIYSNRYTVGTGWGTPTLVETEGPESATGARISCSKSGDAVAVWQQDDGVRANIWANCYVVGTGWESATVIETNGEEAFAPRVATDESGNAIAVWYQSDGIRNSIWSNRFVKPDITPPLLSLDSPVDGLMTETPSVTVSGTTEPGAALNANGISAAVDSEGSFSCEIAVVEGENTITVVATDASDNSATVSVSVTYVNPMAGLEEELNETLDEIEALGDDLDATQAELNATEEELDAIKDDLNAAEEELKSTSDDLESVKSLNMALMAVLAVVAILAVVMSLMFLSLRKKIAGMDVKTADEELPPPDG